MHFGIGGAKPPLLERDHGKAAFCFGESLTEVALHHEIVRDIDGSPFGVVGLGVASSVGALSGVARFVVGAVRD
jgi:hypothetical protein